MKRISYCSIIGMLFCFIAGTAQNRIQKKEEIFAVNPDVIVQINASDSEIIVTQWNKNEVQVKTTLEISGVSTEEADGYFDGWNVEALGNAEKVVVNSQPVFHNEMEVMTDLEIEMPEITEMEIDFEPVLAYAFKFDSVTFPSPPEMPVVVVEQISKIEWDQEAYKKDKEKYMESFREEQKKRAKEFEEKIAPQMKEYEVKMEKWREEFQRKYQPQMEEYQKEMAIWQKEFEEKMAPKIKEQEEKILLIQEKMETEIAPKLKIHEERMMDFQKSIEIQNARNLKIKKKIHIYLPKDARVKLNTHNGSIQLPKRIKRI